MHTFYIKVSLCVFLSYFYVGAMDDHAAHNAMELRPIIEHAKLIAQEKRESIPNFIAIAGCSAVGKSYFTQELAGHLKNENVTTAILKGDDFLDPDHNNPHTFHCRLRHDWLHAVLQKIQNGEQSIRKPVWNPEELRPPFKIEEDFIVKDVDVILFEGEFTLCEDDPYNFKQYSKFCVFIDADNRNLLDWNWSRNRDIAEKTREECDANLTSYLQKYRGYVQSSAVHATYLVSKDKDHGYAVKKNDD